MTDSRSVDATLIAHYKVIGIAPCGRLLYQRDNSCVVSISPWWGVRSKLTAATLFMQWLSENPTKVRLIYVRDYTHVVGGTVIKLPTCPLPSKAYLSTHNPRPPTRNLQLRLTRLFLLLLRRWKGRILHSICELAHSQGHIDLDCWLRGVDLICVVITDERTDNKGEAKEKYAILLS
jgi:hypothetical protein